MADFTASVSAVLRLFQTKFVVFGFFISYWDVLVWSAAAGIVISFLKGVLLGEE